MKHDDTTLQAAIDAAMLDLKTGTGHTSLDTYQSYYWRKEARARLALAKAFLAKLPEPQPILADDGRSLEQQPDSTDWKARAEKAQVELAALESSQLGILRQLSEAGPVLDGCVRIYGFYDQSEDCWPLSTWKWDNDTHFADIRIPNTETPAPVNEQPKQQVPLGPEDCPPGSIVTNSANSWYKVQYVTAGGVRTDLQGSKLIDYEELKTYGWSINTSLPDTGRWDANAWRPCSKPGKEPT